MTSLDFTDQDYDDASAGARTTGRYQTTRTLIRWTPEHESRLLAAYDYVMKSEGVKVNYERIARLVDPDKATAGAIEQHISKVRKSHNERCAHTNTDPIPVPPRHNSKARAQTLSLDMNDDSASKRKRSRTVAANRKRQALPYIPDDSDVLPQFEVDDVNEISADRTLSPTTVGEPVAASVFTSNNSMTGQYDVTVNDPYNFNTQLGISRQQTSQNSGPNTNGMDVMANTYVPNMSSGLGSAMPSGNESASTLDYSQDSYSGVNQPYPQSACMMISDMNNMTQMNTNLSYAQQVPITWYESVNNSQGDTVPGATDNGMNGTFGEPRSSNSYMHDMQFQSGVPAQAYGYDFQPGQNYDAEATFDPSTMLDQEFAALGNFGDIYSDFNMDTAADFNNYDAVGHMVNSSTAPAIASNASSAGAMTGSAAVIDNANATANANANAADGFGALPSIESTDNGAPSVYTTKVGPDNMTNFDHLTKDLDEDQKQEVIAGIQNKQHLASQLAAPMHQGETDSDFMFHENVQYRTGSDGQPKRHMFRPNPFSYYDPDQPAWTWINPAGRSPREQYPDLPNVPDTRVLPENLTPGQRRRWGYE